MPDCHTRPVFWLPAWRCGNGWAAQAPGIWGATRTAGHATKDAWWQCYGGGARATAAASAFAAATARTLALTEELEAVLQSLRGETLAQREQATAQQKCVKEDEAAGRQQVAGQATTALSAVEERPSGGHANWQRARLA